MPHEVTWLQEGRVILHRIDGDLTLEELKELSEAGRQLILAGRPPVHLVADLTRVQKFPVNLTQVTAAVGQTPPHLLGWTLVITHNVMLNYISIILSHVSKAKMRTVASMEEAYEYLRRHDISVELPEIET